MTEAELMYWAAYYEGKTDEEKRALQRQKQQLREYVVKALFICGG